MVNWISKSRIRNLVMPHKAKPEPQADEKEQARKELGRPQSRQASPERSAPDTDRLSARSVEAVSKKQRQSDTREERGGESDTPPKKRRRRRRPRGGRADASGDQSGAADRSAAKPESTPRDGVESAAAKDSQSQSANWSLEDFNVEPQEGKTRFHDIGLPSELMRAVDDLGFKYCTPVQADTLPHILAGRDVAGQAQTGTGKTAAFLLGMFKHMLDKPDPRGDCNGTPRALVVAPTRELVVQLARDAEGLTRHTDFKTVAVYGGLDYAKQERQLRGERVDLIAATPGRLIDYLRKRVVDLSKVEILVLDEADRMLDMGFIPDVRRIVHATPHKDRRQTLLYSATLSDPVMRLASSWMTDPVRIEINPDSIAAESVDQKVFIVTDDKKYALLYNLLKRDKPERVIIFANRRDQVEQLTHRLKDHGFLCNQLSGAVSQKRRMRTLDDFRAGKFNLMIATDVAGRGLHIEGVSHIINYNVPQDPEDYIHRIGRTGRAGSMGTSITFACEKESFYLPPIEELLGEGLSYTQPEEGLLAPPPAVAPSRRSAARGERSRPPRRGGGDRRGGGRRRR
jgi:ATP-dependent RNA helicase RhlB